MNKYAIQNSAKNFLDLKGQDQVVVEYGPGGHGYSLDVFKTETCWLGTWQSENTNVEIKIGVNTHRRSCKITQKLLFTRMTQDVFSY